MLWVLSFLLVGAFALPADARETPFTLYRIRVNFRYGFIDKTGKVVVPPVFEQSGEFSEGLAWVKKDEGFGYIDTTGRFVIEPVFYAAESFSDGLAVVVAPGGALNNGVRGYIDKSGKMVIKLDPPNTFLPWPFAEGLAVYIENEKSGYIDKTGRIVIQPQFDWAFSFSEGLAKVRVGEKYGYIDQTGKIAIEPQFPRPYSADILGRPQPGDYDLPFRNGLAAIEVGEGRSWAYIDRTGKVVFHVPNNHFSPFTFSEGRVNMRDDRGDEGYFDLKGNIAIKPAWRSVKEFSEGLAAAEIRNNSPQGCENNNCWEYIDIMGNVVIKPQFSTASPFRDGLAWVVISIPRRNYSDSYKQGYIDRTGKFVWFTITE
jgi:hypothetical protein